MGNNLKNQHYKNMGITLQMLMYPFEAESVAYTVCQHYGIETSDYSFAYIAGWSHGKETPELKASLNRIRTAASEMISSIDAQLQVEERAQTAEKTEKDGKGSVLADLHEKAEKTEQKSKSPGKKKTKAKEETR